MAALSELPSLSGKVCIVTGASRGIGKGIALMLGKAGATVYITGRTLGPKDGAAFPGSLRETAQQVESLGGQCIPVQCDHGNDNDVKKLFERVKKEQNGRLDVLVNNAYKAVKAITDTAGVPFYEQSLDMWDEVNNVGLRSNYVAAYYAAQIMVPAKQGLIINISSPGGLTYLFNIPYGVGKAANDRMMQDMGVELKKHNVAAISLWPGPVKTEVIEKFQEETVDAERKSRVSKIFENSEDVTFTGKAIAWLAADANIMKKTGKVLVVAELAREYGFTDIGGEVLGPAGKLELDLVDPRLPLHSLLGHWGSYSQVLAKALAGEAGIVKDHISFCEEHKRG